MSAEKLFTGLVPRMDVHGPLTCGPVHQSISAWADVGASGGIGYPSSSKTLLRPGAVAA